MKEIIQYIADFGFITVFAGMGLYFLYRFGKIYLSKYEKKIINTCLRDHYFFTRIDYFIDYRIEKLDFGDKGRKAIFRDMLKIKFEVWKKRMLDVIDMNEKLEKKVLDLLFAGIKEYEDKWKDMGIPAIVIKKFNEWHDKRVSIVKDDIILICNSAIYKTTEEKKRAILSLFCETLTMSILDAEYTFKIINGDLKGLTYKDFIIN